MSKNSINVNISFSTIIKITLFFILLFLLFFFQNLVLSILTAIVIATSLEPIIHKLEKIKIPRVFATILIYIILLGLIATTLLLFIPNLAEQGNNIYKELPTYIQSINSWAETQTDSGGIFSEIIGIFQNQIESFNLIDLGNNLSTNSTSVTDFVILIFGGLFSFILIIVLSFYFALQEHGIDNFLKIITPAKYTKYAIGLWKRSQKKIGYWMQGQLILGLVIGVITYLGLVAFFGFEESLLLACVAVIAELIPVIGPFIAAVPALAIGLSDGGISMMGGVAIFYLVIQMIESQLIYPLVVKKVVGVPSFLVIISLIVGAQLFGFLGVVLSIPTAAALMEFIKDIEKKQEEEIKKGEAKEISLEKK